MIKRKMFDKFELYIPTKARDGHVEQMLATLTEMAHGMTAASVQGGYVGHSGTVMLEGVVIYTFYAGIDTAQASAIQNQVDAVAYYLLAEKGEESVLLVTDGQAYLYEAH